MIKNNLTSAYEQKDGIQSILEQLDNKSISYATQTNIEVKENSIQKTDMCICILDMLSINLKNDANHIADLGLDFAILDDEIAKNMRN